MALNRFKLIDGVQAIIKTGNNWKQVDCYERKNEVYVKQGSGFVKLHAKGYTGDPKTFWIELDDGLRVDGNNVVLT